MIFNNVAQMKSATLASGVVTSTVGYTTFNDGGQANYAVKTLAEFGSTPNELSDITLANGNIAVLMISEVVNARSFGATGDSLTDDTEALRAWAAVGGRLYLPRGVYRVTGQIVFPENSNVFGESAGAGTGGSPKTELEQAASGTTMVRVKSDFSGESVFKFVDLNFKHNASVMAQDFQILNDRDGGAQAHLLEIINGYDLVDVSRLNLMFSGGAFNALRVVEDSSIGAANKGQTLRFSNIVGIGDDSLDSITPTMFWRRQQEMILEGVKSFGCAQAVPEANRRLNAMAFLGCRGVALTGCSSAITLGAGIHVYSTDRSSDGISIVGQTYEQCEQAGLFVDGTQTDPAVVITRVNNTNPRYQFPQSVGVILEGSGSGTVLNCRIDGGTSAVTIGAGVGGCDIKTSALSRVTDVNVSSSNLITATPNENSEEFRVNKTFEIQKDTAAIKFVTFGGDREFTIKYSASDADDFGFQLTNEQSGAFMLIGENGNLTLQASTTPGSTGSRQMFKSPTGLKQYQLRYDITDTDVDSGFIFQNEDTSATLIHHPNGDLAATSQGSNPAGTKLIIESPDGTLWAIGVDNAGTITAT
jgi:hypothetical protein